MGYQLNHVCNKPKAFELERIGHNFITLTISLGRKFEHRKTFYSENFKQEQFVS